MFSDFHVNVFLPLINFVFISWGILIFLYLFYLFVDFINKFHK